MIHPSSHNAQVSQLVLGLDGEAFSKTIMTERPCARPFDIFEVRGRWNWISSFDQNKPGYGSSRLEGWWPWAG